MKRAALLFLSIGVALPAYSASSPANPQPPSIRELHVHGDEKNLRFPFYPAAESYTILSASNPAAAFTADAGFTLSPYVVSASTNGTNYHYEWRATNSHASSFYRLAVTPMASNALLAATILQRLTYGPTPDELDRIQAVGPEAYLAEQLAPWTIAEDADGTHTNLPFIAAKFAAADQFVTASNASIADFRAWHILRAIGARRQFLEILLQFLENHFVTEYAKSSAWFDTYYDDSNLRNRLATQLEHLENSRWRAALLNPACTFHDLLKISAESPAMLIYLDTVISRGDGKNTANENYAREIMELFCMGVDNGYDQNDITVQSRIWTGWRIEKVDFTNAFNPLAAATTNIIPGSTNTSTTTKSNLYGVWAFNYKPQYHSLSNKLVFGGKTVPSRYGPPWTTRTYGTNSVPGRYEIFLPGLSSTNGIQEGYQFLQHLADLPFTQEYISIKLCRLLVHDEFPNPSNDPDNPAFPFYNYVGGSLSPEADLVYRCMLTWETNSPRGQIWKVVKTITDSDLFRSHGASLHKIKTPLEYVVSAVRALRSSTNGSNLAGSFTADSDGYAIGGTSSSSITPLTRMGQMLLFSRDAPDGYPEAGPAWISAGTLAERLRYVQSLCIASGQPGHTGTTNDAGNTVCDLVGLLRARTPPSTWTNAAAVADYFLHLLYPAEGTANLALYRDAAVGFLNDGSAESPPSAKPFHELTVSSSASSAYDQRVRGMVAMLMTMKRFQEQ